MESAYKKSGVDIDVAAHLIERIKPHVAKTKRSGVMGGLGGFGALFDLKQTSFRDPVLVSSTDGVGTKLKIAIDTNSHDTIGIDAVAMCVNDVVVQGAEPLFFLDYFATGKLDNDVAEAVIAGIARGCAESGCALIGGETAEMPGVYGPGDYDIAGFCVGAVERDRLITGERIGPGDVILGLASSGLHSNGYSLVRRLVREAKASYDDVLPFAQGKTLGEVLLTPTRLYVRSILKALNIKEGSGHPSIKGMAHITGGGLIENIPRVLPDHVQAQIDGKSWTLPPLFQWLAAIGRLSAGDMAMTLNCGVGMVVICGPDQASALKTAFEDEGEQVFAIGAITARPAGQEAIILNNWHV
ncbi:MAG: phosphoribosylformylglycinamidine cyclo-ligase [Alphaproteobacteria bacterium]|nr:phosphoribosylformylglycinamidine cyclo-ligase [Alphaproteobacteria bacterium]